MHEDSTAVSTLEGFINTPNATWGLSTAGAHPYVIDLRNGRLRPDPKATAILGSFVMDHDSSESPGYLTDPATGRRVAPEPGRRGGQEPTSGPFYGELSLAPQGIVHTNSDGTSPPAVLSSDGAVLIGLLAESGTSAPGTELVGYSLPDGKALWHAPNTLSSVYIYGDGGGRVLVSENGKKLVALNDHTGAVDWQLSLAGTVCGITAHQILLAVHGQLATIASSTGQQLSYTGGNGSDEGESEEPGEVSCPTVASSGITVGSSSVERLLQP